MLKIKTKVKVGFVGILSVVAGMQAATFVAKQQVSATDPSAASAFQVNVVESLTVSLSTPSEWASGQVGQFLRNTVNLKVTANNSAGFTATMYSDKSGTTDSTGLLNTTDNTTEIPTLTTNFARSSFPANYWGYSLEGKDSGDTTEGTSSGVYKPLSASASPITVLSSDQAVADASQNIFFGAKADITKAAGTYQGSVVVSVVSGATDPSTNPVTPTNPANPSDDATYNDGNATATINSKGVGASTSASGGTITSTNVTTDTSTSGGVNTTQTQVAAPLGVTEETVSNINHSAPLATGLAVAAGVAAASGATFFILAKRKKDDDEEEEEEI